MSKPNNLFQVYIRPALQPFFSSLQLLIHTRWEVFCPLQPKMKVVFVLLSATLAYAAANPGYGHAYHNGPHCHDKKEHQCHKKPKHQEHEECYVDYDIIVDVTYIEECEYVVITHCEEEHEQVYHNSHIAHGQSHVVDVHHDDHYDHGSYHKRSAKAGENGYSSGHNCKDKKIKECSKQPDVETRKIPRSICKKVVDTIYIEECEEIIHTQCEESHDQYHHSSHIAGHDSQKIASSHHSGYDSYGGHH